MTVAKGGNHETDIPDLVEKYAWRRYKQSVGFPACLLCDRNQYYVDIGWDHVDFKHYIKYMDSDCACKDSDQSESGDVSVKPRDYRFNVSTIFHKFRKYLTKRRLKTSSHLKKISGNLNSFSNISEADLAENSRMFTKTTIVSLPKGKLPVRVGRLSDKHGLRTIWIENLSAVLNEKTGYETHKTSSDEFDLYSGETGMFEVFDKDSGSYETICKSVAIGCCAEKKLLKTAFSKVNRVN